jgi:tetratricopeptide (TPR) repeat protein
MKSNPRAGIILPVIVLLGLVLIPAGILLSDQSIERISARTAHAAMESGNFEVAVAEYMKAAAYASEGALYWDEIGQAALSAGDPGTAVHYLEKAMGYGGFAPEDWASLGQAYFNLGDIKQAAEALDRANNESDPQPEIVGQLLEIHSILGDDEAVVRDLSQLVELEPENLEAQLQLGLLLAARCGGKE